MMFKSSLSKYAAVASMLGLMACSGGQQSQPNMSDKHKHHATGRTTVKTYEPKVFDEVSGGPSLTDIHLTETFSGDIEGDGVVHVVQEARADRFASFVGIERVRGSIGGKNGTFLLQVRGSVVGKEMGAEWFVIPGSGTGELRGLRGDGGFKAELGQHGTIWLDYSPNQN
ncbi:MAG TPA: DUF3224 domain-containing protein [Polyangiaceae bacterium]|nr:DUF3224 domain-containing protein [Polyangiaceae bacterium]